MPLGNSPEQLAAAKCAIITSEMGHLGGSSVEGYFNLW